jgi:hypothetical protein
MQTPAPAVQPSQDRSESGGRPSLMPNIQRPTAPATRPQFTPRPSGGARPEAAPSIRGNRGGNSESDRSRGRGAGNGFRGQRD